MHKWDAERYSKTTSDTQRWGIELVSRLHLEGWERVLDIGCGDGRLTAEIARQVPRGEAIGVDSSPEMVRWAQSTFSPKEYANLRFRQMDASRLEFSNELDVVFSNSALHWVADHRPILSGIRRGLRPGGRVLMQMGGRGNAAGILASVMMVVQGPRWRAYFRSFSSSIRFHEPEEYGVLLSEAGLKPVRVELVPRDMAHNGRGGLAAWVRAVWLPFTQRVPEPLREDLIADIVEAYVNARPVDDSGLVHVDMVRLEVEATG